MTDQRIALYAFLSVRAWSSLFKLNRMDVNMFDYDKNVARLGRLLRKKGFQDSVTAGRPIVAGEIDGEIVLRFCDGHQAFGNFAEMWSKIESATSLPLLMAMFDLDEQLSD